MPRPLAAAKLERSGRTSTAPRTGSSWRVSTWRTRASPTGPRPKRSGRTATTAFRTWTFRYTLMLVTLTTVVRWMTTLLTTRGPPQPPHQGRR